MKKILIVILVFTSIIGTAIAKEKEAVTEEDNPKIKEAYEYFVLGETNPAYALNNEANFYAIKGMTDEAIEKYLDALELSPGNPIILNNLAWTYIMTGDFDQALTFLNQSINIDSTNPSTNFYLGVAHWESGNIEKAQNYLDAAISLDPTHPYSHYYRAKVYEGEGDFEKALKEVEIAAFILDNDKMWNPDVALYLGDLYAKTDMLQKAILQYQKLTSEPGYEFDAYYGLGVAYGRFEDFDKSEAYFLMAMDIDDDDPTLNYALSKLYSTRDEYLKKAMKFAEKALKYEPENPKFLYLVGWIYYRMGETKNALEFIKEASGHDPENETYRYQVDLLERELDPAGARY